MSKANLSTDRNLNIDRIRGVSILLVIALHYSMFCPLSFWPFDTAFVGAPLHYGTYGVTMFFTISGFLITTLSLKRWGDFSQINIFEFYVMRASRILPGLMLLLLALCLLNFVHLAPFKIPPDHSIIEAIWYAITFRYQLLLFQNNVPGMIAWGPIWSLSVEELFYLAFPLCCLTVRRRSLIVLLLFTFVLLGPINRQIFNYYTLAGSSDALAFGCLAAIVAGHYEIKPRATAAIRLLGLCLIGAGIFPASIANSMVYAPSLIAFGVAVYLLGSKGHSRLLSPVIGAPDQLLRRMGRHSYEIYLFHLPLILALSLFPRDQVMALLILRFIAFFAIIIGIAHVVAKFYTEPLNRYLRKSLPRWVHCGPMDDVMRTRGFFPTVDARNVDATRHVKTFLPDHLGPPH